VIDCGFEALQFLKDDDDKLFHFYIDKSNAHIPSSSDIVGSLVDLFFAMKSSVNRKAGKRKKSYLYFEGIIESMYFLSSFIRSNLVCSLPSVNLVCKRNYLGY
jgi:hypothetical protein